MHPSASAHPRCARQAPATGHTSRLDPLIHLPPAARAWGPRERCTDPPAPSRPSPNPPPQSWPTLHANLPAPAAGPSLSSLLAAAARSRAEAGTLQGEKFPHALRRLSPPGAHVAPHLHPAAAAALLRRASAGAPGSQIITLKSPRTLAFAGDPRLHRALPPWSSSPSAPAQDEPAARPPGHPAAAAAVPAARSPGLEPRAEALGVRRLAGEGGEPGGGERQREEADGARDPKPQPRAQRSLPGAAPALVPARCRRRRRRRYCSPPRCSQLPITADADARPSPSPAAPSRSPLAVSSSQPASEKGEGERSLGVPADSRSRSAARGERGRAGGEARRAGGRSRRRAGKLD